MTIIDLQCCKDCHLPSDIPSTFQSSMTTFHYHNTKMQNVPNYVSRLTSISSKFQSFMTMLINLFITYIINHIKYHMTLNANIKGRVHMGL